MSGGGHGGGHGGGRGRKKGGHAEEHENHERWLVTYADMLTLLFVLFVVLYAMGALNTSKYNQLKSSLASAFNNGQQSLLVGGSGIVGGESQSTQVKEMTPTIPTLTLPTVTAPKTSQAAADLKAAKQEIDQFSKIKAAVNKSLAPRGLSGVARYSVDERGLVITIVTDNLVFAGNSATLEGGGQTIMNAVVPPLKTIDNQLQVDGHTNQANVSTYPYPSGWELSSARASSVVRYLIARGLAADRLSAVGYSDQRPLISPSDPLSVTRNRRVDIVVLSKLSASARTNLSTLGATLSSG